VLGTSPMFVDFVEHGRASSLSGGRSPRDNTPDARGINTVPPAGTGGRPSRFPVPAEGRGTELDTMSNRRLDSMSNLASVVRLKGRAE